MHTRFPDRQSTYAVSREQLASNSEIIEISAIDGLVFCFTIRLREASRMMVGKFLLCLSFVVWHSIEQQ